MGNSTDTWNFVVKTRLAGKHFLWIQLAPKNKSAILYSSTLRPNKLRVQKSAGLLRSNYDGFPGYEWNNNTKLLFDVTIPREKIMKGRRKLFNGVLFVQSDASTYKSHVFMQTILDYPSCPGLKISLKGRTFVLKKMFWELLYSIRRRAYWLTK